MSGLTWNLVSSPDREAGEVKENQLWIRIDAPSVATSTTPRLGILPTELSRIQHSKTSPLTGNVPDAARRRAGS